MNIYIIDNIIKDVFHDDVSDIKIIDDRIIFFICYGTIPAECWLSRGQLEVKYGTFGVLNSEAGNIKPLKNDYEAYLLKYAELQLQALKELCISILPDKYLNLYKSGFQITSVLPIRISAENDLKSVLQEVFTFEISNIFNDDDSISFIMHETICFTLKMELPKIVLSRQLIRGYSVELLELDYNKKSLEYIVNFIRVYSDAIIPDEWLSTFHGK